MAHLIRSALLQHQMFSVSKNITSDLRSTLLRSIDCSFAEFSVLCVDIFASASVIEAGLPATIKEIASASARGPLALIGEKLKLSSRYVDFSLSLSSEEIWSRCDYIASFQTTKSEPNQTLEATPETVTSPAKPGAAPASGVPHLSSEDICREKF